MSQPLSEQLRQDSSDHRVLTGLFLKQRYRQKLRSDIGQCNNICCSRFLGQQRGQRGLSDTTRGFKQNYAPYASQYGARGMQGGGLNSGVYQKSMANYVGDYYRDFGRQQQDLASNMQQFDLDQGRRDMWRQEELNNIDMDRYRNIASSAQNLQALRDWLGGL